jgi:hypothetical protein
VPQLASEDGAVTDVDPEADLKSYELPDGTKVQGDLSLAHIPGEPWEGKGCP